MPTRKTYFLILKREEEKGTGEIGSEGAAVESFARDRYMVDLPTCAVQTRGKTSQWYNQLANQTKGTGDEVKM